MTGTTYRGPARHAHSLTYWLLIGWWWETLCWTARVLCYIIFLPLGIWRSARKGRKNRERRERRGYR